VSPATDIIVPAPVLPTLYPKQDAALFEPKKYSIIFATTKAGKAQPLDSVVYTPIGPVLMGDLSVGDRVCVPGGESVVSAIHPRGEMDVYRVIFCDGSECYCTLDHLWEVSPQSGFPRVLPLSDILSLSEDNRRRYSVSCSVVEFDAIGVDLDPYLVGVLLGDGCLVGGDRGIDFSSGDDFIVDRIRGLLPAGYSLNACGKFSYRFSGDVSVRGYLQRCLRGLGLEGTRSDTKFIPDIYKYNSVEVRMELLRGLMDTDGFVDNHGQPGFEQTSSRLAADFSELVEGLGGSCSTRYRSKNGYVSKKTGDYVSCKPVYRQSVRCVDAREFFSLPRKVSAASVRKKPVKRTFRDIEFVGKQQVQCISVSTDRGVYFTDHCILTHNSVGALVWAITQGWEIGGGCNIAWMAPVISTSVDIGYMGMLEMLRQWNPGGEYWREVRSKNHIEILRGKEVHCRFIFFGSDNPNNIYGKEVSAAIVDEGSRCTKDAWVALLSTLTFTGGPVRVIGNVRYKSDWMYELGEMARAGSKKFAWHKITCEDAIEAGVLDREIVEERRAVLTTEEFMRDYMAVPMDMGAAFFKSETVEQQRRLFAVEPERMRYDWEKRKMVSDPGGSWHFFQKQNRQGSGQENTEDARQSRMADTPGGLSTHADGRQSFSIGKGNTSSEYVFGVDISYGVAGSNSVIAVMDKDSGRLVAEYVDPNISPEDLADLACAVGKTTFKGRSGQAYICWEANGPGEGWFRNLLRNDYYRIYYQRREGSRGERKGRRYGWHSTRVTKMDRLGDLRSAMTDTERNPRRVIIPSHPGLDETLRYIYCDDGSVGPDSQVDLVSGARANHGDRVIAYMVALMGLYELESKEKKVEPVLKPGSFAAMMGMDKVLDVEKLRAG